MNRLWNAITETERTPHVAEVFQLLSEADFAIFRAKLLDDTGDVALVMRTGVRVPTVGCDELEQVGAVIEVLV